MPLKNKKAPKEEGRTKCHPRYIPSTPLASIATMLNVSSQKMIMIQIMKNRDQTKEAEEMRMIIRKD